MTNSRRTMTGTVVSNKMTKTVIVAVERHHRHPLYHRIVRTVRKFKARDEQGSCNPGDQVLIEEFRPLSKEVRWRVASIVRQAKSIGEPEANTATIEAQPENLETQADTLEDQPETIETQGESSDTDVH